MTSAATLVSFISFLIKYGPTIWASIRDGVDEIKLDLRVVRELKPAEKKAEETGDQRDLENLFSPGRHKNP
jgi:hypothetical protein